MQSATQTVLRLEGNALGRLDHERLARAVPARGQRNEIDEAKRGRPDNR